jgi:hypothetical protein
MRLYLKDIRIQIMDLMVLMFNLTMLGFIFYLAEQGVFTKHRKNMKAKQINFISVDLKPNLASIH